MPLTTMRRPSGMLVPMGQVGTTHTGSVNIGYGVVWVGNYGNNTISRFNQDGSTAGPVLSGNGLSNPYGIALVNPCYTIPTS